MEQAVSNSKTIEQDSEMLADDMRPLAERLSVEPAVDDSQTIEQDAEMLADDPRSLAERRPRRMNRRLPARYRDILPQPPPPPMAAPGLPPLTSEQAPPSAPLSNSGLSSVLPRTLRFFTTLANSFSLSHRYYGDRLPTHDPEDKTTLQQLTLTPATEDVTERRDSASFYPYPNRSSFLLGDWYWNGGIQKSQESFKELIKIVGAPGFQPEDVSGTRWNFINTRCIVK